MTKHDFAQLASLISEFYGVDTLKVLNKGRKDMDDNVIKARAVLATIAYEDFDMSLKEIGRMMGGRDHATIISVRKYIDNITFPGIVAEKDELKIAASSMWLRPRTRRMRHVHFTYGEAQDAYGWWTMQMV